MQVKDYIGDKSIFRALLFSVCRKLRAPLFYDNMLAGNYKGIFSFDRGESVVTLNAFEAIKGSKMVLSGGDLEGML